MLVIEIVFVGLEEQHVVSNRCMVLLGLSMDV